MATRSSRPKAVPAPKPSKPTGSKTNAEGKRPKSPATAGRAAADAREKAPLSNPAKLESPRNATAAASEGSRLSRRAPPIKQTVAGTKSTQPAAAGKPSGATNKARAPRSPKPPRPAGRPAANGDSSAASGRQRTFLAPELGGALGQDGEVRGGGILDALKDPKLRQMGAELWRSFQRGNVLSEKTMQEASLTPADIWAPGLSQSLSTSSTAQEIDEYRRKLMFRADCLEAMLEATLSDLEHVSKFKPHELRTDGQPERSADLPERRRRGGSRDATAG